jgi:peptidyl-tRNA hydrolase, PTH1 family
LTAPAIELIVGLGNPGAEYAQTRHNAGYWLIDTLAGRHGVELRSHAKFFGTVGRYKHDTGECWLLKPTTYMNRSGQSVAALAQYYRIPVTGILVVHDDLDLPPGTARLKCGGGHGGHNGLRDITELLGSEFLRLRLGIGHPGSKDLVLGSVLGKPSAEDRVAIESAIAAALDVLPLALGGDLARAMNKLHGPKDNKSATA